MATKASGALETLKLEVRQKFAEIVAAVQMREKLLLRQLDVIATSQLQHNAGGGGGGGRCHVTSSTSQHSSQNSNLADIKFLAEQEIELMSSIRSFGRFQLDNMNLALHDVYLKNEDYIEPTDDHETMYKCLPEVSGSAENESLADAEHHQKAATTTAGGVGVVDEEPEAIVVDFSRNKSLVEHSRKLMNKSIINITLQEAKELIRKARLKRESSIPPLNLEELDDEMESSIADALSSLECRSDAGPTAAAAAEKNPKNPSTSTTKQPQQAEATTTTTSNGSSAAAQSSSATAANIPKKCNKKRCKPKITINNCNGTINLRNISSLTINCASEEAISAEIPLHGQSDDEEEEVLPMKTATPATKSKKSGKKSATSTVNSVKKALECIVYSSSTNNTETSTSTTTPTTSTPSSSNYSSNASSRSQSKKQSKTPKKAQHGHEPSKTNSNVYGDGVLFADYDAEDDGDANVNATCDFYNRLLNEIKNNLHEKPMRYYKVPTTTEGGAAASSTSTAMEPDSTSFNAAENTSYIGSSSNDQRSSTMNTTQNTMASSQVTSTQGTQGPQPGKRLILKNFENLKIILEANSGDEDTFHPVQIEQWLAEIISESDLEPMPNTDILEHSNLHSMNENAVQQDGGGDGDDDGDEVGSESKVVVA